MPEAPITGTILSPANSGYANQGDLKAHAFFNVLRTLVRLTPVYHDEQALELAISAVDDFEKHILSGPHHAVVSETDTAPREDVSQRVPPRVGTAVVPAAGPGIDYNRLAAALFAMQQQRNEQPPTDGETEGTTE